MTPHRCSQGFPGTDRLAAGFGKKAGESGFAAVISLPAVRSLALVSCSFNDWICDGCNLKVGICKGTVIAEEASSMMESGKCDAVHTTHCLIHAVGAQDRELVAAVSACLRRIRASLS